MDKPAVLLIRELRGTTCRCGAAKETGKTFCRICYESLPVAMRAALYRRVGKGYEEAYAKACEVLGLPAAVEQGEAAGG